MLSTNLWIVISISNIVQTLKSGSEQNQMSNHILTFLGWGSYNWQGASLESEETKAGSVYQIVKQVCKSSKY